MWVDTLDLSRWPLALEDVRFRVQALALRHLTTLTVAGKNDLSDEELATFGNLPKLKCLSLNHCNKVLAPTMPLLAGPPLCLSSSGCVRMFSDEKASTWAEPLMLMLRSRMPRQLLVNSADCQLRLHAPAATRCPTLA